MEDMVVEINKFHNTTSEEKQYKKIGDKADELISNLGSHNDNILGLINNALINALKLDEEVWKKIEEKYYYDFHQVRDESGQLKYTYTLNKYSGLAKRGYCMKSDWKLDIEGVKTFLTDKKAVEKLTKISGYKELIDTIQVILDKLIIIEKPSSNKYNIIIPANDTEKQMFIEGDREKINEISYNFITDEFHVNDNNYGFGRWDKGKFSHIKRCVILDNHKDYINKENKKIMAKLNKQKNIYKAEEDSIKQDLAKWLMIEMI